MLRLAIKGFSLLYKLTPAGHRAVVILEHIRKRDPYALDIYPPTPSVQVLGAMYTPPPLVDETDFLSDTDVMDYMTKAIIEKNTPEALQWGIDVFSEVNDMLDHRYQSYVDHLRTKQKEMNRQIYSPRPAALSDGTQEAGTTLSAFAQTVIVPGKAEEVIRKLHELMDGREKPKDALMPIRAAMDAAAIRRPTWPEFCQEFGEARISSKGLLSKYTNENYVYMGDDYERLKAIFLDII